MAYVCYAGRRSIRCVFTTNDGFLRKEIYLIETRVSVCIAQVINIQINFSSVGPF